MENGLGEVKLSCRNIWKVYAGENAPYFMSDDGTLATPELCPRMRDDAALPGGTAR